MLLELKLCYYYIERKKKKLKNCFLKIKLYKVKKVYIVIIL